MKFTPKTLECSEKIFFFYLPTEAPRAKEKSNSTGIKLSTELVICNHLIFKANNLKTSSWMCSLVLCQLALTSHPPHETSIWDTVMTLNFNYKILFFI